MSIPQSDIDHILRMEGNADYARMKIATEFSKGKGVEEIAAFLQSSFHGGNGVVTENGRYSAWYAEDGIHIANGDAARYLTFAKVVSCRRRLSASDSFSLRANTPPMWSLRKRRGMSARSWRSLSGIYDRI